MTLPSLRTKESFGMNVTRVDLQRMTGIDSNADHLGVESFIFLGNLQAFSDVMSSALNVFEGMSENFTLDEMFENMSKLRFSCHFDMC